MSSPKTPREIVLDIVRQQLAQPELSFEQALEHPSGKFLIDSLLGSTPAPAPVSPVDALVEQSGKSGVIRAAINDTYVLDELEVDAAARDALLGASDLVMIAGSRRLRLQDAARAATIAAGRGHLKYGAILYATVGTDAVRRAEIAKSAVELPSLWLRCFLTGEFRDLDTAPPIELKAALAARERLRMVDGLPEQVPPVADLSRRVGLAELLEPLRILIGAEGGWDGRPRSDRFVGRDEELRFLRAFVDELGSHSATEAVARVAHNLFNIFTGSVAAGLMVIKARGGLGKSTLLAKFVLEHAVEQATPFPFAYLDFDRAGIDPDRSEQLLLEIIRQVALQFPDAQPELSVLATDIRKQMVRQGVTTEFSNPDQITDPFARFAEILRERVTHGQRAFLLVFDTLEIVQWNASSMQNLAAIVDEFRRKGLSELRVVASGRADVPELQKARGSDVPVESIELKPLLVKEARLLANSLGSATLGRAWQVRWGTAIAGTASDNEIRREPLAVRVATDLVARTEPAKREEMVAQIASEGLGAADDFVARLYEKRIVNHVQDPRAKKLAWPGLVVRRVTSEIVREVLAPLCEISPDEADAAFLALGQEIWMVFREDAAGTVLRHRPDLRARTLPLMRRKNPDRFRQINQDAIAYFARHRRRSLDDFGEWIYHRLLADEPIASIEKDMVGDVLPMLAKAEADFAPGSAAASFLAARTAQSRLAPKRIRELQPVDALYHLSTTSVGAFALDDADVDRVAIEVAGRVAESGVTLTRELEGWARALWIKVGAWQRVPVDASFEGLSTPVLRTHAYWAARMAPRLNPEQRRSLLESLTTISGSGDKVGLRTMVQAMAIARFDHHDLYNSLDVLVARILRTTRPNPLPSIQAALRNAIMLGRESRGPALELWLTGRSRGSGSDRVRVPTVSRRGVKALAELNPLAAPFFDPVGPARITDERIVSAVSRAVDEMMGSKDPATLDGLSRIFAVRQEDWIIPIGHAAARARRGLSDEIRTRLAEYAPGEDIPTDMVAAARLADEAGELGAFVAAIARNSEDDDLKFLADAYRTWTRAIDHELQPTVSMPNAPASAGTAPSFASSVPSDQPPPAPKVVHKDDPQLDRWGGQAERNGRALRASLASVEGETFYFGAIVESTDGSPLAGPVVFHLHDTYQPSIIPVTRIVDDRHAALRDLSSYGVFAIGAQVKDRSGSWTSLELNLAALPGLPKRFLDR
jgi:hypothetical protein